MKVIYLLMLIHYQLIPTEYLSRDNLFKYIEPQDSIQWWKAGIVNLDSGNQKEIYCSDSSEIVGLSAFTFDNTYFSNYFDSPPTMSYLAYKTKSSQIKYIHKVEELRSFFGTIDNLAEALLLASIYGYFARSGIEYGSYYVDNNTYILNLTKIVDPPDVITIILDKNGNSIGQKPINARIRVDSNGDVYEVTGRADQCLRKLIVEDMYRSL